MQIDRALLPSLVEFMYRSKDEVQINDRGTQPALGKFLNEGNGGPGDLRPVDNVVKGRRVDYDNGDEHVLVLDLKGRDGYGERKIGKGQVYRYMMVPSKLTLSHQDAFYSTRSPNE